MRRCKRSIPRVFPLAIALVLAVTIALAQTGNGFDLAWWSMDGGGGECSGGNYALAGSIGQPDAGDMSGGSYDVAGGFFVRPCMFEKCAVELWDLYAVK